MLSTAVRAADNEASGFPHEVACRCYAEYDHVSGYRRNRHLASESLRELRVMLCAITRPAYLPL
jgi:hypothetical protein